MASSAKAKHLDEWDSSEFLHKKLQTRNMHWVRTLSVASDGAPELVPGSTEEAWRNRYKRSGQRDGEGRGLSTQEVFVLADLGFYYTNTYYHLNLKSCRCCLLPSKQELWLNPNRRVYAGLWRDGPGRRLYVTYRGFLALVPGERRQGGSVTIMY